MELELNEAESMLVGIAQERAQPLLERATHMLSEAAEAVFKSRRLEGVPLEQLVIQRTPDGRPAKFRWPDPVASTPAG